MVNRLEISPDIINGESIIKIYGRQCIFIENYKSIIEYTDKLIRIQGKKGRITICGNDLCILYYTGSDMRVDGNITELLLSN